MLGVFSGVDSNPLGYVRFYFGRMIDDSCQLMGFLMTAGVRMSDKVKILDFKKFEYNIFEVVNSK